MTLIDVVLIVAAVVVAITGYRQGLLVGLSGLIGFLLGGAIGLWVAPWALRAWTSGLAQTVAALAVVLGCAVLLQVLATGLAVRVRDSVDTRPARIADSVGGSVVSVIGLLLACWLIASLLLQVGGDGVSSAIRSSAVLSTVDRVVPGTAQDFVNSFESVVQASGFPTVFGGVEQITPVGPPNAALAQPVVASVAGSLVKVQGVACRKGLEGSGFVIAPERVLTNAHVVAGVTDPQVQVSGVGRSLDAQVVLFDPAVDVAVLKVPGLRAPALGFDPATESGQDAVVAGFPGDGPLTASPARVRGSVRALGRDIYDDAAVTRDVISLRAQVRPGNSGGPLLSDQARVLGLVFAASTSDPETGYALSASEVAPAVAAAPGAQTPVSTGRCT